MAKLLKIVTYPNKILRAPNAKINQVDDKLRRLILDMELTMRERDGVGLAAPQVGKNIRLIVINTKDEILAMINPKISKKSWQKEIGDEGCLSVPDFFGPVKRHKKINISYLDKNNKKIKMTAEGLLARVIQHEVDHLNGILFIDYIRKKNLPPHLKTELLA